MSRPEKCSKLSEVEDRECGDRISSLPDEVLGHMLSFLPTRRAVATSVLSTRWRCLHMLTNCLYFDVRCWIRPTNIKAHKKSFKKFVNRVLLLHKVSPIKKFHFDSGQHTYDDDADIHSWVSAVLLKGVEQLDLSLNGNLNALPHRVFSCQTIVELKLCSFCREGFRVPESIYLPSLKKLDLCYIQFLDMESCGKFFSASPLLEDFSLVDCEWPMNSDHGQVCLFSGVLKHLTIIACENQFEVDAPNLVHLEYDPTEGKVLGLSLKNSDRLIAARLELPFNDNCDSIEVALALIKAVCHVKELHLLAQTILEYVRFFEDDHPPSFPNLTELYLDSCSCHNWKYVTHWLSNSPRLEKLVFNQSLVTSATGKWLPNVTWVPFSSRVKVIEASNFCGNAMELTLLGYLLRNARVLKKLILYKKAGPYVMTRKQELLASKKLLMLPRASRTCVIQLKKEKQN